VIDTSALVAALIAEHEHHRLVRPRLRPDWQIPAIVLAETFAQLRRTFRQPAGVAASTLRPWTGSPGLVLPTPSSAITSVFRRCVELDLGGSIHDALIAQVCVDHNVPLVTLDARQHQLALALGARSTYVLA
jgi:predicted nucleic acid-binding protein